MGVCLVSTDVYDLFRRFRHDLFNDLQILSGHIQLGRTTDVLRGDVNAVVERIQDISRIFSCKDNQLALLLWSWQEQAVDQEITISLDIEQLTSPAKSTALATASELVSALLPSILGLEDEEHWVHVRVDHSGPALFINCAAVPAHSYHGLAASTDEDGQLEFCIPLTEQN